MKKKLVTLFGAALLLAGCNFFGKEEISAPTHGQVITFSLGTGIREAVTYAPQIHDANEYGIDRLDIFEFDKNSDGKYYLSKIYKNHSSQGAATPDNPAKRTVSQIVLPKGAAGTKKFLFVANMADPGDAPLTNNKMADDLTALQVKGDNGQTGVEFDQVKAKLTTAMTQQDDLNLASKFLMTGETEIEIAADNGGTPINKEVFLTRNVARLDVAISLVEKDEILTINKIEFQNVPDKAYLMPSVKTIADGKTAFMAPDGFQSLNYKTYNTPDLTSHFDGQETNYYKSRYKQLYYFYELAKEQFKDKTPTVIISGEYQKDTDAPKVKVRYIIPFDRDIKRNHIYTIILGIKRVPGPDPGPDPDPKPTPDPDEDKYETTFEINTLKWEEDVIDHTISPLISTSLSYGTGNKLRLDPATHTISVLSGNKIEEKDNAGIIVKSMFAGDEDYKTTVQVLTADPAGKITTPNNSWFKLTPTSGNSVLKFTVEENNEVGERKGIVWLKTANSGNYYYPLVVSQPKKTQ